jgi:hypothetical protein
MRSGTADGAPTKCAAFQCSGDARCDHILLVGEVGFIEHIQQPIRSDSSQSDSRRLAGSVSMVRPIERPVVPLISLARRLRQLEMGVADRASILEHHVLEQMREPGASPLRSPAPRDTRGWSTPSAAGDPPTG